MNNPAKSIFPERNPKTHAEHRREVFWQITLPLGLGILLLLAAVAAIIFLATQPVTDLGRWTDVSLMWIIIPALLFAFIILIILSAFVFAVSYLLQKIPRYAHIVQLYFELGKGKINQLSNITVGPVIKIRGFWAAVQYASRLGKNKRVSGN